MCTLCSATGILQVGVPTRLRPQSGRRRETGFLLAQTCHLYYATAGRFPVNIGVSRKSFSATTIRLVVRLCLVGLLFSTGCTTVQTERTAVDQSLRSRTVRGPRNEILNLAVRCVHREFPDGVVRTDPVMGEVVVTDYSVLRGDAELKIAVTGWPDDRVDVSASATGLGTGQQRMVIGKFLDDFDQTYADWVKEQKLYQQAGN